MAVNEEISKIFTICYGLAIRAMNSSLLNLKITTQSSSSPFSDMDIQICDMHCNAHFI